MSDQQSSPWQNPSTVGSGNGPAGPTHGAVPPYGQQPTPAPAPSQWAAEPTQAGQSAGEQSTTQPDREQQIGYGQPAWGQLQDGEPAYGQQAYGAPAYGQQAYGAPAYGQPGPPPYGAQPIQPTGYPALPVRSDYATWGKRAGAYLIDFAPSLVAQAVFYVGYVQWIIGAMSSTGSTPNLTNGLVPLIVGFVLLLAAIGWQIYNRWIVAGRTGQSLGKRVLKISLIDEATAAPIGPLNAFVRDLVHILDGMAYVGYLWPLWDEKKQTFADKLVKTAVIDAPHTGAGRP